MKKKGFTIIELLSVIVVLAIIALITIPVVTNVIEKSRKEAASVWHLLLCDRTAAAAGGCDFCCFFRS